MEKENSRWALYLEYLSFYLEMCLEPRKAIEKSIIFSLIFFKSLFALKEMIELLCI